MAEEEQAWYYMVDGEQVGPISAEDLQQYAAAGTIHAETEVWTDGLDQWVPATHVEGLVFGQPEPAPQTSGPRLIVGAAAQTARPLAGEITPQAAAQPVAAPAQVGYQQPGMAAGFRLDPGSAAPGSDYPATGTKRASYGMFLGCSLGGIGLIVIGFIVAVAGSDSSGQVEDRTGLLALGMFGMGFLLLLIRDIICYIYLYRAWNCLRFGAPRTTPGKAVGFMFIPFFNLYWIFVAHYGLAQDWNRVMGSHPNLQAAPRMSEGMFLTALICSLSGIGLPVAVVLWFIVYKQVCDGVNFMATQNMRQSQPTGMRFY